MLKTDHPIYFDDTEIPYMKTWDETSETIENSLQTEAGTDIVQVMRYDKLSISCATKCMSDLLGTLKGFSKTDSFTLTQYDPITGEDEERIVRMRDFQYKLVDKTWELDATEGLWEVSFKLLEF